VNRERFTRNDWLFFAVCAVLAAASLFVIVNWFTTAFPEASIDFRYTRDSSRSVAEPLLASQRIDTRGMKHAAVFDGDDRAKIFLERTLGLSRATGVMHHEVRLWWWHHRWFRPQQEEELSVDVAPTGEIVSFEDHIPEAQAVASPDVAATRQVAEAFLARAGVKLADLQLVSQSERALPRRMQRIFTWESQSVHPAGAPYRHVVTIDGNRVGRYEQRLKVPDDWIRGYSLLRSKNNLAGLVDFGFLIATMICIVVVFIMRLLRGDVRIRMAAVVFVITFVLVIGNALNAFPTELMQCPTTSSFATFIAKFIFLRALIPAVAAGMMLLVIVATGEVTFRERFPQHLAIPKLWTPRTLASKRVFRSFVLGYTLVALFLGYQVAFYLIAEKFGAWSPAEVPYDAILNSAIPWIAVLFAGFFPSLSEEFMSRAFSIPFFERVLKSRLGAIVLAGFIWGFGHSTYANQPFFIRGLEVGIAGCILGALLYRFGLLPLLIWHYTVDALYTALLLLRSGNRYYIVSGALASLVFAIPMIVSIVMYVRNRGFIPDDDLSNETLPLSTPPERVEAAPKAVVLAPLVGLTRTRAIACAIAVAVAMALLFVKPHSVDEVTDYRTTTSQATATAKPMLPATDGWHVAVAPVEGFRSWDRDSPREEGGSPGGFDGTAAEYLVRHGVTIDRLVEVMRTKIAAATWMVRAYKPQQKEEVLVEVDPRANRAIGFHKYQDEKRPGARLEQPEALAIATRELARYGINAAAFDAKEVLAFQQPNRRDWLIHFEERQPLATDAHRRVSVRVAGNEVTQFTTTIKVPDSAYREREEETMLNVVLQIVRLIAVLALLALAIAGFVVAARKQPFPWRRPLRWTAILGIVPIASAILHWPLTMFEYPTTLEWQTFIGNVLVRRALTIGFELGAIFLSVAAIEVAYPHAVELLTRSARARSGRAATVAALTAIALVSIYRIVLEAIAVRFPAMVSVSLHAPSSVAIALPSLLGIGEGLLRTVEFSATVGLFLYALRLLRRTPWLPDVIGAGIIFLISIDSDATPKQLPLMVLFALSGALLIWAIVRYLFGGNLLAYPLTIALIWMFGNAASLLHNDRPDLIANGVAVIVAALALIAWCIAPREAADA